MNKFEFKKLEIPDIILIIPKKFEDKRGYFSEIYQKEIFKKNGIDVNFVQDNISFSKKGVLRGLHYQINPYPQGKLVKCIKGKIIDVAVDIRKNSPFFKRYVKVILSEENNYMLWIPKGFAHGFLALEDSIVFYKVDNYYNPKYERGIIWNDKTLSIKWGIENPVLSEKDKNLPSFENAELF